MPSAAVRDSRPASENVSQHQELGFTGLQNAAVPSRGEENQGLSLEGVRGILRQYWGYDDFRPGQDQAIQNVLGGGDSLTIMPTGGGKSLCYQVPAMILPGVTLVVSPLISLMKEQRDSHLPGCELVKARLG